ncbi:MAG: DUF488 family protein [Caldilineaceae bacterium]
MNANQPIPIYTIGHANRTPAQLVDLLQRRQIAFLIDVRTPTEQAAATDFSASALTTLLQAVGIRYVDMTNAFADADTGAALDYPTVRISSSYRQAIVRLQNAFQQQHRIALLGASAAGRLSTEPTLWCLASCRGNSCCSH